MAEPKEYVVHAGMMTSSGVGVGLTPDTRRIFHLKLGDMVKISSEHHGTIIYRIVTHMRRRNTRENFVYLTDDSLKLLCVQPSDEISIQKSNETIEFP